MEWMPVRGGPFSEKEKQALLDYCEEDVKALVRLLPEMLPMILGRIGLSATNNLGRSLLHGRYMKNIAMVEMTGTPIDVNLLNRINTNWGAMKASSTSIFVRHFVITSAEN